MSVGNKVVKMTIDEILKLIDIEIKKLIEESNNDLSNSVSNYLMGKANGLKDAKKILECLEDEKLIQ